MGNDSKILKQFLDDADFPIAWANEEEKVFASWKNALGLPGVRGLVVGRALLYPKDDDVAAAVDIAAGLVAGT
jgi:hypothetical protein